MGKCGDYLQRVKGWLPGKSTFSGLFQDMSLRKWVKYALFTFNIIIIVFSLAVMGLSSAAINAPAFMEGPNPTIIIIALAVSLVCFIVSAVGIFAVVKDHKIILIVYSALIGVIVVAKLTLIVMLLTSGFNLDEKFVSAYRQNGRDSALFDNIFRTFECCGMNGTNDFYAPKVRNNIIPKGCCKEKDLKLVGKTKICRKEHRFHEGCNVAMGRSGNPTSQRIVGLVVVFCLVLLIELLAIAAALYMVFVRPPNDGSSMASSVSAATTASEDVQAIKHEPQ